MNSASTAVRNAISADCARIAIISREAMGYECTAKQVESRLKGIDSSREAVFVSVCNDVVTGFVHVELYDLLYAESMANILGLAVDKNCRRQEIGGRLLSQAECWAKERGAVGMRLNSGAERREAHQFYRCAGYNSEKQQIRFEKLF